MLEKKKVPVEMEEAMIRETKENGCKKKSKCKENGETHASYIFRDLC